MFIFGPMLGLGLAIVFAVGVGLATGGLTPTGGIVSATVVLAAVFVALPAAYIRWYNGQQRATAAKS
jgi:CBS-domain-containing membrane protein